MKIHTRLFKYGNGYALRIPNFKPELCNEDTDVYMDTNIEKGEIKIKLVKREVKGEYKTERSQKTWNKTHGNT